MPTVVFERVRVPAKHVESRLKAIGWGRLIYVAYKCEQGFATKIVAEFDGVVGLTDNPLGRKGVIKPAHRPNAPFDHKKKRKDREKDEYVRDDGGEVYETRRELMHAQECA